MCTHSETFHSGVGPVVHHRVEEGVAVTPEGNPRLAFLGLGAVARELRGLTGGYVFKRGQRSSHTEVDVHEMYMVNVGTTDTLLHTTFLEDTLLD